MAKLINIDNGGTLTDICVVDGANVHRVKTLTTPHDLSRCLIDGLTKASREIFGSEDLDALLADTLYIRYSTTQGTNALVERKGQRLGLILSGSISADDLRGCADDPSLFDALVSDRYVKLEQAVLDDDAHFETALVKAVAVLTSNGANRIVVGHAGNARREIEQRIKAVLIKKFPQHLLGAVPVLYAHEVVEDESDIRRVWTALFNSFLHPAMERFLYSADHKLRSHNVHNPLLIFRNDGDSARVAKTIALKTYSSGPRGGMEGAKAVAEHYGIKHLLTMDVGGTTTDIGEVVDGVVRADSRGHVEGVEISFPLCDVVSAGVGGSSIIRAQDGAVAVGPESVGSAPGPACFAFGGQHATATDAFLLSGLLDSSSYFGGEMNLDADRAATAVVKNVADPLRMSVDEAVAAMEGAWVEKIARSLKSYTEITKETTLAAFGGAGPFVVCAVAEAAGISRILIPGLAPVFSAFGVGFSDISHCYEAPLLKRDGEGVTECVNGLMDRARRGMFAEGFDLEECNVERWLQLSEAGRDETMPLGSSLPSEISPDATISVAVKVTKPIPRPILRGNFGSKPTKAVTKTDRTLRLHGKDVSVPLYRAEEQPGGAVASGPAVLEDAYYTCRIDRGWKFEFADSGDILLTRE